MRTRNALVTVMLVGLLGWPAASAAMVDLSFDPASQVAYLDDIVEVDFWASSDGDTAQLFATIEAIFDWDPAFLEFLGVDDTDAGYAFLPDHFLPDPDGINADLTDGDALFVALAPGGQEAAAPPTGLMVTTLQFRALAETDGTVVSMLPSLGDDGLTRVRRLDGSDVTGAINSTATVTILPEPASLAGVALLLMALRRR